MFFQFLTQFATIRELVFILLFNKHIAEKKSFFVSAFVFSVLVSTRNNRKCWIFMSSEANEAILSPHHTHIPKYNFVVLKISHVLNQTQILGVYIRFNFDGAWKVFQWNCGWKTNRIQEMVFIYSERERERGRLLYELHYIMALNAGIFDIFLSCLR